MAKGSYTIIEKNKPIASQLRAYESKERGYSLIEKELKRRFAGLDWRYQKRIIVDFIQGGRSTREWVFPKLLNIWDKSFEPLVKGAWEKYHDERCSWVVIRQMPEDYVLSQLDELAAIEGNYRFICRRLAGNRRFEIDMNRLEPLDFFELLKNGVKFAELSSDELFDVFLRSFYNWTKRITYKANYCSESVISIFCFFMELQLLRMKGERRHIWYVKGEVDLSDSRNADLCKKIDEWYDNVMENTIQDYRNVASNRERCCDAVEQAESLKQIREDLQKRFGMEKDANDDTIGRYLQEIYTNGDILCGHTDDDKDEERYYGRASLDEFAEINPAVKELLGNFEVEGNGDGEDEVVPF